jgi:hypothetical protein
MDYYTPVTAYLKVIIGLTAGDSYNVVVRVCNIYGLSEYKYTNSDIE